MTIGVPAFGLIITYHHIISDPPAKPTGTSPQLVHTSISHNGAFVFLLANLLTGLLNYLREPLNVDSGAKEFISLYCYSVAICLAAFFWEKGNLEKKKQKEERLKKNEERVKENERVAEKNGKKEKAQ